MITMPSQKRKGISSVATVLIFVITIVTAALVGYFLYSSTARSTRTPVLEVVGQPTLYANSTVATLYVTFKNDGTSPVNLAGSIIIVQDKNKAPVQFTYGKSLTSSSTTLDPGTSGSFVYTSTSITNATLNNIPDGALATLQTSDGYQLSFAVAKP